MELEVDGVQLTYEQPAGLHGESLRRVQLVGRGRSREERRRWGHSTSMCAAKRLSISWINSRILGAFSAFSTRLASGSLEPSRTSCNFSARSLHLWHVEMSCRALL